MKKSINILNLLKFVSIYSILITGCSSGPAYTHTPSEYSLPVKYCAQKQQYWCWAACSEMVMKYLDTNNVHVIYEQCALAHSTLDVTQRNLPCCVSGNLDNACNHTNWPVFEECGFSCINTDETRDYFSWEDMCQQIDSSKPICLTWNWNCGGAHMIVMDGYKIVEDELFVHLLDPYAGFDSLYMYSSSRYITQSENRYGNDHILGRCYYGITKN
ncbi:MAG: papain-like cysteine protease family protein [Saprospiraceae bacterium]